MSSFDSLLPKRKSEYELSLYREFGKKFGTILRKLKRIVESGNYNDLEAEYKDLTWEALAKDLGSKRISSFTFPFTQQENKQGEKFNHCLCISPNEIVAHGIPVRNHSNLNIGDVVSIDCGLKITVGGTILNFDSAFTTLFGATPEKDHWLHQPRLALEDLLGKTCYRPANTMDIAVHIKNRARKQELLQVVALTGHGIGRELHEAPQIHNAPASFQPVYLFDGIVFCAEPIYVKPRKSSFSFLSSIAISDDNWSIFVTRGEQASHFETMFAMINGQLVDLVGISDWES
jgi:methionyl aminopeptidase